MGLNWHIGRPRPFDHKLENIYYFPDGGSFNDVIVVEVLYWHRRRWNLR